MVKRVNVFWFRRDLRLEDNCGLHHALQAGLPVLPVFIFDKNILDALEDKKDNRVNFIYRALLIIKESLEKNGSSLLIRYGFPFQVFNDLAAEYPINTVFTNQDYEPYAMERDREIQELLLKNNIHFQSFKDQVIFEKDEVTRENKEPYYVFTPYSRRWIASLTPDKLLRFKSSVPTGFYKHEPFYLPRLDEIGFELPSGTPPMAGIREDVIREYDKTRNIPSVEGTSRAGVHLRFGTVSVRYLVNKGVNENSTFLNELIWREFFMQQLWRQPELITEACKKEYDKIQWRNNELEFQRWCNGDTGFPIVDAGMRELNSTGFMHNRVRMITASFLVKHLLIDWRWGEAYFAKKLMDYDLSANIGNWQWVAGCGCDAAPYFRIFNPYIQAKKFDPENKYVKRWVPELNEFHYPQPMVDHAMARDRCLKAYKKALAQGTGVRKAKL